MGRDITASTLKVYQAFYDSPWKSSDQFDAMSAFCKTKGDAAFLIWSAFSSYVPKTEHQTDALNELGEMILEDMTECAVN